MRKTEYEFVGVPNFRENGDGTLCRETDSGWMPVVQRAFLRPIALSRTEGENAWALHVEHADIDGNRKASSHSLSDVHSSPKTVLRKLTSDGIILRPGEGKALMRYLQSTLPSKRYLDIKKSGWLEKSWTFVAPNWVKGPVGEEVRFLPEVNSSTASAMTTSGTLEQWQDTVARPLRGNPIPMFALMLALLGPLLKVLGLEGGGFHLGGRSSGGKTTCLQAAGSIYGRAVAPSTGKSVVVQWNNTSNGLEGLAACHSDQLLALDEIGLAASNDLGRDIYLLAGGRGKVAMDSQRQLREVRSWRGNLLSSGEMSVREAIEMTGGKVRAGMLLRLSDIPVGENAIFPNPPEGMSAADLANSIQAACGRFYGVAGEMMVDCLLECIGSDETGEENIKYLIAEMDKTTIALTPKDASPEQARAVRRFAAVQVAGLLAAEFGILPYSEEEVIEAVQSVVERWAKHSPAIADIDRSMMKFQDFLLRYHTGFASIREPKGGNGKGFHDHIKGVFVFTDSQLTEASGSSNLVELGRELRSLGFLFANEGSRLKSKHKLGGDEFVRLYSVKRSFLTADLQSKWENSLSQDENVIN